MTNQTITLNGKTYEEIKNPLEADVYVIYKKYDGDNVLILKELPSSPSKEEEKILHIYGQGAWHEDVRISGTPTALKQLGQVLTDISKSEVGSGVLTKGFFVNDGEGFDVVIENLSKKDMDAKTVPYTEEIANLKPKEENECECCKGVCNCEYGCHHVHNNEDEEDGESELNMIDDVYRADEIKELKEQPPKEEKLGCGALITYEDIVECGTLGWANKPMLCPICAEKIREGMK